MNFYSGTLNKIASLSAGDFLLNLNLKFVMIHKFQKTHLINQID